MKGKRRTLEDLVLGDDDRVEEVVPNFYYFGLRAAAIDAHAGKHAGHDRTERAGFEGPSFFDGGQIDSAPLGEDALAGRRFARTEWGAITPGGGEHR